MNWSEGHRPCCPLPKSQSPAEHAIQGVDNTALTETGKSGDKSENQNLVSGLFFESEIHTPELPTDLGKVVAAWPQLPEHIKAAINALIQTHQAQQEQTGSCGGGQS